MLINVYNQPQEILVQSVSVHKDHQDPLNTYLFRCPYCGFRITQFQGMVDKLQPGLVPGDEVVVINQCHECHMRYVFRQSPTNHLDSEIVLTMYENPTDIFRCYICRTALVRFNEYAVTQLSNKQTRQLPFGLICYGPNCQLAYRFVDLV